jgi:diacylglycerol O-acyltransferase
MAGAWRISVGVTTAAAQALQGAAEIAGGMLRPAAASSLTGPRTRMRRYAWIERAVDRLTVVSAPWRSTPVGTLSLVLGS